MSRFLASYNLLYKAGYPFIATPSGELSPERPAVSELPSLSSFAYFICLTLVDRIININVQASWIMHLKQENFLLPLLSHTSSHKPSELPPVTKMPQKIKTWRDLGMTGHVAIPTHETSAIAHRESSWCACHHALKSPSADLRLHKSPIVPFTTYWLSTWGWKCS